MTQRGRVERAHSRFQNLCRTRSLRFFNGSLPGVEITDCNFTRTKVEVWYVTERADSDTIEEELRKKIGSNVEPYELRLLRLVKKSDLPIFKYTPPGARAARRMQLAALAPTSP